MATLGLPHKNQEQGHWLSWSLQCPGTEDNQRPPQGLGNAGLARKGKLTELVWLYIIPYMIKNKYTVHFTLEISLNLNYWQENPRSEKVKVLGAEAVPGESAWYLSIPAHSSQFVSSHFGGWSGKWEIQAEPSSSLWATKKVSPLPGCESSKLYLWCPHHGMASSAPVLSDESAPTFPSLHLLPLLSPQALMSLYCWFSFISKSTALLRLPVSFVAHLAAFQSLPIWNMAWPTLSITTILRISSFPRHLEWGPILCHPHYTDSRYVGSRKAATWVEWPPAPQRTLVNVSLHTVSVAILCEFLCSGE